MAGLPLEKKEYSKWEMKSAKIEYIDETFKPHKDLAKKVTEAAKTSNNVKK